MVLVYAPRISVWEGKITAELLIFMAEIRDGRRGKNLCNLAACTAAASQVVGDVKCLNVNEPLP